MGCDRSIPKHCAIGRMRASVPWHSTNGVFSATCPTHACCPTHAFQRVLCDAYQARIKLPPTGYATCIKLGSSSDQEEHVHHSLSPSTAPSARRAVAQLPRSA
eukprot:3146825-Pleurochrysis_carterae.AAC.3